VAATLKRRYAAKLIANLIGLAIGLVIAIVVPRGLGPEAYGNYNFLSTFFLSLMGFFTLNTESCFFVKLSQRPQESKMINFYLKFNFLAIIVLFIFMVIQTFPLDGSMEFGSSWALHASHSQYPPPSGGLIDGLVVPLAIF
jgi:O-antigen/teichoic acid export membrane protein